MTSTAVQKLTKQHSMRPTETFPEYNLLFRLTHLLQYYRLNRGFERISFKPFQVFAAIISLTQTYKAKKTLRHTWEFFFPRRLLLKFNPHRWSSRFIRYNIELYLGVTFFLPLFSSKYMDFFAPVEGFHHLENALRKQRGVLVPILHLGQFYHTIFTLFYRTVQIDNRHDKIKIVALGTPENEFLVRELLRPIKNIEVIITNTFRSLKEAIAERLQQNCCVFLAQDYFSPEQMRVPFLYGYHTYDFLIPSPQAISYFHIKHRTPIIPVVALPGKNLKHSTVVFFPEIDVHSAIWLESQQYLSPMSGLLHDCIAFQQQRLPEKKAYGMVSTFINHQLYPFILKYPFYWQGAFLFFQRTEFEIKFPRTLVITALIEQILLFLRNFVQKSYEPDRDEEEINRLVSEITVQNLQLQEQDPIMISIVNRKFSLARCSTSVAINRIHVFLTQNTEKTHSKEIGKILSLFEAFSTTVCRKK